MIYASSLNVVLLTTVMIFISTAAAEDKPITTAPGELGDLLRRWDEEGTAAGNDGDWYDNRDGGHSDLDPSPWPRLQRVTYSDEDRKAYRNWLGQTVILPNVVFGNSSTSDSVHDRGSNGRDYYCRSDGLAFLYKQYTHNNLYIYPEHLDHDAHGFGDLFPTNTPYLIVSQGSSWSDQPFMKAIPFTLAAFRPEVKKKLIETGLLMPTVQMIFRMSNKHLGDDPQAAYLTGKAHPTVFEGGWVDELKMAKLAHEVRLDAIPPMVQLKVVSEDGAINGRDFFEAGGTEKLADTPCAIARVFRATASTRTIVVSAEPSYDVNHRPLTYRWAVLRGDEAKVRIKPMNPAGSVVQITVRHPERRPVAEGSTLESNRVDIGAFVHNGAHYSAPAFVTFFGLDNESRTEDEKGRLLEVGYGHGKVLLLVSNWPGMFDALKSDAPTPGVALFKARFSEAELAEIARVGEEYTARLLEITGTPEEQKQARQAVEEALTRPRESITHSVRTLVEWKLAVWAMTPDFAVENAAALDALFDTTSEPGKAAVNATRRRLVNLGIAADGSTAERLTAYEKSQLTRAHGELLARLVLPGLVTATWRENLVDSRITKSKDWRDVYRYDAHGVRLGWTRYSPDAPPADFDADGLRMLDRDKSHRPESNR